MQLCNVCRRQRSDSNVCPNCRSKWDAPNISALRLLEQCVMEQYGLDRSRVGFARWLVDHERVTDEVES